jgi:murein DD-endopeptidase MepM/ murein hydrolase activator NlpD
MRLIFSVLFISLYIFNLYSLENNEIITEYLNFYNEAKEKLSSTTFIMENEYLAIDHFGFHRNPFNDRVYFIEYTVINMPLDSKVFSITDGIVSEIGWNIIMGNYIKILYDNFEIIYGHLYDFQIENGSEVFAGQFIGYCGRHQDIYGNIMKLSMKYKNIQLDPNLILNFDDNRRRL